MVRVGSLLRAVRVAAGLSQRALAERAGVAQPRIAEIEGGTVDPRLSSVDRALRAGGAQLAVIPSRSPTAVVAAAEISGAFESGTGKRNVDRALRSLLSFSDGLAASSPDVRVALCVAPPAPTGELRFDAALAAVVDHHLGRDGLPVPAWAFEPRRVSPEVWVVDPFAGSELESEVPESFRRRGVLLSERELVSA